VQDKLSETEKGRLKLTSIFSKEILQNDANPKDLKSPNSHFRYKASELYAPNEILRNLDMPLLDWPGKSKWRSSSDEAKFLINVLGLKTVIPWHELIHFAALSNPDKRSQFLNYFIENHQQYISSGYQPHMINIGFLPTLKDPSKLCTPSTIFANIGYKSILKLCCNLKLKVFSAEVLGFDILDQNLKPHASKFGVNEHPSGTALVNAIKANPPTLDNAESIFIYMSSRQQDLKYTDWKALLNMPFIPLGKDKWIHPSNVYFSNAQSSMYKEHFNYIGMTQTPKYGLCSNLSSPF
jgi:hypothetical protein